MSNTITSLLPTRTRTIEDQVISLFNNDTIPTFEPTPTKIPNCSAASIDWVLYVATIVTLCLGWWLFELPLLCTKPCRQPFSTSGDDADINPRGRTGRFYDALRWNCVRSLMPSYVAVVAMARNIDPKAWAGLYYFGAERISASSAPFTRWQWTKILLTDFMPVVFEVLLIARSSKDGMMNASSFILPGWWLQVYMVPCFVGWYLLVLSHMPKPPHVGLAILLGGPIILLGGIAISAPAIVQLIKGGLFPGISAIFILCWLLVMVPFTLMRCCGGRPHTRLTRRLPTRLHLLVYLLSGVCRIMPLLIGMFDSQGVFPFCSSNYTGVIIAVAVLGGLLVVWLATSGGVALCETFRPDLMNFKNRAASAYEADRAAEEIRALQVERNAFEAQEAEVSKLSVDKREPKAKDELSPQLCPNI